MATVEKVSVALTSEQISALKAAVDAGDTPPRARSCGKPCVTGN